MKHENRLMCAAGPSAFTIFSCFLGFPASVFIFVFIFFIFMQNKNNRNKNLPIITDNIKNKFYVIIFLNLIVLCMFFVIIYDWLFANYC